MVIPRFLFVGALLGVASAAVAAQAVVRTPVREIGAAPSTPVGEREQFPFASQWQERRDVSRVVRPTADKSVCLVNYACFCDGPLNEWNQCGGTSTCRPRQDAYCAYMCMAPFNCAAMNSAECENYTGCN